MNRKNFGNLIEQLRSETALIRPNGKAYTQREMAENLGITLRHYGRLERGEVVNIEGELLVNLAEGLKLTARERQEFFYAAGGVSQYALKSPYEDLSSLWSKLEDLLKATVFPIFVSDVVGNILLASKGALPIVGFDKPEFLELKYPNVLWAPLKIDLNHAFTQETLFKALVANLRLLRGTSLRYRSHNYCKNLFNELQEYSQIKNAWQLVSFDTGMDFTDTRVFEQFHPSFNLVLAYYALGSKVVTSWGDLYVTTLTPTDEKTFGKFMELKKQYGNELVRTEARWPFPAKVSG